MAFMLPVVKKSCCGFSLEIATKIIGFAHVFIIGVLFLAVFIYHVIIEYRRFSEDDVIYNDTFNEAYFRDELLQMTLIGNVAFSACLLYGTYKRESIYFEPWLILKACVVGFSFFNVGIFFVIRMLGHKLIDIFLQLMNVGVESYMFIIVYSLYMKIKANEPS